MALKFNGTSAGFSPVKSIIEWERKRYRFRMKNTVKLINHNESLDMVLWCKDNLNTVKIEGQHRIDVMSYRWKVITEWNRIIKVFENNVWPYSTIRIWFKNEEDAMAFKLRWL